MFCLQRKKGINNENEKRDLLESRLRADAPTLLAKHYMFVRKGLYHFTVLWIQ